MIDICLLFGGLKFSVWVVLLCVCNGELFVQMSEVNVFELFFFLFGGVLSIDEDVVICVWCEWEEEMGLFCGLLWLVVVVENFFGLFEKCQYEIGFYFCLEEVFVELLYGVFSVFDNMDIGFEWVWLDELGVCLVYLLFVCDLLSVLVGEVWYFVIWS